MKLYTQESKNPRRGLLCTSDLADVSDIWKYSSALIFDRE